MHTVVAETCVLRLSNKTKGRRTLLFQVLKADIPAVFLQLFFSRLNCVDYGTCSAPFVCVCVRVCTLSSANVCLNLQPREDSELLLQFAHTFYVFQRSNSHSWRLASSSARSSSQIIVKKNWSVYIYFFKNSSHIYVPLPSPGHLPSLHHSTLLCLRPALFILSQITLPRLPEAPSITAPHPLPPPPLCSSHSALKLCRNFSGSFDAWMSPVWVHLVWAAAPVLCDLNCAASLQVSLHGRLVSERHFGHKLSGALIVKINSDQSRRCTLSLSPLDLLRLSLCFSPSPLQAFMPPSTLFFLLRTYIFPSIAPHHQPSFLSPSPATLFTALMSKCDFCSHNVFFFPSSAK